MPSPVRAMLLARTLEADFQAHVIKLAEALGYRWYHTHDSRRSPGGFPDLVLARRRSSRRTKRHLFVELKREGERVPDDQQAWHDDLVWDGAEAYIWWPHDLDRIAEILQ